MGNKKNYDAYDDTQMRAFSDIVKSAYERGNSNPEITPEEFVEELKEQLSAVMLKTR